MNVPTWAKVWTQDGWASANSLDNDRLDRLLAALVEVIADVEAYSSLGEERTSPAGVQFGR